MMECVRLVALFIVWCSVVSAAPTEAPPIICFVGMNIDGLPIQEDVPCTVSSTLGCVRGHGGLADDRKGEQFYCNNQEGYDKGVRPGKCASGHIMVGDKGTEERVEGTLCGCNSEEQCNLKTAHGGEANDVENIQEELQELGVSTTSEQPTTAPQQELMIHWAVGNGLQVIVNEHGQGESSAVSTHISGRLVACNVAVVVLAAILKR